MDNDKKDNIDQDNNNITSLIMINNELKGLHLIIVIINTSVLVGSGFIVASQIIYYYIHLYYEIDYDLFF